MDETAVPARVTKSVTVAVIRQCHKHPRDGDGGHFAVVTEDGFTIRIEDIKCDGVIVCSANAQHKSSRLANSILDAVGFSEARRMVDWPAREALRSAKTKVVVVNDADALWAGLKGKALRVAEAQLIYLSNTSGAKFVLVGGDAMARGVRGNPQLAWRYELLRTAEHVRYFA